MTRTIKTKKHISLFHLFLDQHVSEANSYQKVPPSSAPLGEAEQSWSDREQNSRSREEVRHDRLLLL